MARRGGSSSGGSSVCPDAFPTTIEQASFALDVVLLAIYLGLFISLCSFRKKSVAGKKLLGLPFIGAVFFFALGNACSIIATILQQCDASYIYNYYNWFVAISIFGYLAQWFLFVVVVFNLNIMLHQQLGHPKAVFKTILLVIIGVIGLLMCVLAGLTAYINTESPKAIYYWRNKTDLFLIIDAQRKLRVAYYSLYLVSLLAAGGLALTTILSLRRERKAAGDLIGWIVALTVAMLLWVIIILVTSTWYFVDTDYTVETSLALAYVLNFGQVLSCIFILCIAKHVCWRTSSNAAPMADSSAYAPVAYQQPYVHNSDSNNQAYQYSQAPEYAGTGNPIRA